MAKNLKSLSVVACAAFLLSACAHSYDPVVDMDGVDPQKYQNDLAVCRNYADKVDATGNTATDALVGAGVGAAGGAVLGAITGAPGLGAAMGAGIGGLGGGGAGAANSGQRQINIINNCLKKRGYTILG